MSTDEMEKQIQSLLGSLGDKYLRRYHNSVKISFTEMLAYIDKIRAPIPDGDIKFLLQTYREMAEKFYTQYELSLLDEIKKQNDVQVQSLLVIKKIENLKDTDTEKKDIEKAIPLLENARDDAATTYINLTKNFPTLLQNALDKLKDEWQRLYTIAVASKTLTEDKDLLQTLEVVVDCAAFSVGIEAERITIVPGDAFALNFFTYLENFAVLTVPIYSVRAPWERSIFWHELAGYRVRQLEKDMALTTIRENLQLFYNFFQINSKRLNPLIPTPDLLSVMVKDDNTHSHHYQYISKLFFSRDKLDLSDLGNFEHQFERMLANLPIENKFQNYEQIKEAGWCVDWFKELFEDAWSILAIGEGFLVYFEDVLSRHDATDGRHPPLKVRLSVAKELAKLAKSGGVMNEPKSIEAIAAEQILGFMSLIMAADSYRFFKFDTLDEFKVSLGEFLFRVEVLGRVGRNITNAISAWSTNSLAADDLVGEVKAYSEEFIESLSIKKELVLRIAAKLGAKKEIVSSYETLLAGRDYKELLDLSFYDIDFAVGKNPEYSIYSKDAKTNSYILAKHLITKENLEKAKNALKFNSPSQKGDAFIKINGNEYRVTKENYPTLLNKYTRST